MKYRNVYASYTYFCCGFCCSIILWMQISMALGRSNLYYKYNRISAEWLID